MKRTTQFFSVLFFCLIFGVGTATAVPFYTIEGDGIKINQDDRLYVSIVTDNMDITKENLGVVVKNDMVWRSNGDLNGLFNTTTSIIGNLNDVVWDALANDKAHLWYNEFISSMSGSGVRQFLFGQTWDAIPQGDHTVLNKFYSPTGGDLKAVIKISDRPSTQVSIGNIIPLMLIGLLGMMVFRRYFSDSGGKQLAIT